MPLILALVIGFFAGLRSLTPAAATAWAAHLGRLKLTGTLALIGSLPSVVVFTLLALAELVADKLPKTPARTAPPGLIARLAMGALTGACVAAGNGGSALLGALLGAVGAIAGTFAGFHARSWLAKTIGNPLVAALVEDAVAIAGSLWVAMR